MSLPRDPQPRWSRLGWVVLALILPLALVHVSRLTPPPAVGVDLYQYWGVGQAIALTDGAVRNPYTQQPEMSRVLLAHAQESDDAVLRRIATLRADLELQGTPVAYAAFRFYPAEYRVAVRLHRVLQVSAVLAALCVLLSPQPGLLLGSLLLLGYGPLASELKVGNFSSLLLLLLALGFRLLGATRGADPLDRRSEAAGALGLAALGTGALLKPSLALTFPAAGIYLAARFGRRGLRPIAWGSLATLLVALLPAWSFRSPWIWLEWRRYFQHSNVDMFGIPFRDGNLSPSLLLASSTGAPFGLISLLAGMTCLASLVVAATRRHGQAGLVRALGDPQLMLSSGLLLFFVTSPLVWVHYYALLLAPALALLRWRRDLAIAALVLAAGIPLSLMHLVGVSAGLTHQIVSLGILLSTLPLWAGVLAWAGGAAEPPPPPT